ncbi:MAG: NAD(P)H-dependent oxidoreductase subunit E [Myxococcota bacterium]|nr:NAD(P)H-dependent oxidoreductase subunit E [Myxococcota bacterium]
MLPSGRKPTHEPLDLNVQWDLSDAIEEAAPDRRVSHALMAQVAQAQNAPESHVYIGAAIDPMLQWERTSDLTLHVCVGACQGFGATEVLDAILASRAARTDEGKPAFDIIPRGCLSACERAPVVASNGGHGQALHPEMTLAGVAEVLDVLLEA